MGQPAIIAVEKGAQIVHRVFQHGEAIDADAEGEALPFLRVQPGEFDDTPVDHYLFTDGLTEYSVYIAPRAAEQAGSMSVIGSQNLYTEPRNDVIITVVGQIPIQTAKRIVAEVQ